MNALSIVTFAIFLGFGGAALANQQESVQSNTNTTGPNPFMTFSAADFSHYRSSGHEAFGSYPVQDHASSRREVVLGNDGQGGVMAARDDVSGPAFLPICANRRANDVPSV